MASRRFEIINLPEGVGVYVMVEHNNPDFVCAGCGGPGHWGDAYREPHSGRVLPIHQGPCAGDLVGDDSTVRYA